MESSKLSTVTQYRSGKQLPGGRYQDHLVSSDWYYSVLHRPLDRVPNTIHTCQQPFICLGKKSCASLWDLVSSMFRLLLVGGLSYSITQLIVLSWVVNPCIQDFDSVFPGLWDSPCLAALDRTPSLFCLAQRHSPFATVSSAYTPANNHKKFKPGECSELARVSSA